ncbi:LysR family transcriptional regulator [Nannocystis sp.]|uniref:LysR family transcriptional regulator n=1 Tax=Nannocystis sp. TaxID=1962667 RepID=UPI002425BA96|nr:LysR family transcriptional regulator [Nannocystis sp.]MBK7828533.1 LysR family transcriptional regulator [Nannocystis sp.]MBK9758020.1 LysR family transcriptional regulator [Nannocystis sp.]
MLPDFNRLRVFFHVHQARSVGAAALALHVTQSAVSQSLAKLEAELGAQLFIRRHRAIVPTAAGDALYSVVAPFVAALQGGIEHIRRARHELAGTLRIGAPVEFGSHRLTDALAAFSRAHPAVSYALRLGHPAELVPLLADGQLDLCFADLFDARRPAASRMSGLEVSEVMDETLVLIASAALEREHLQGSRAFARLAPLRFIDYQAHAPAVRSWFRHHFERVPPRIDLALTAESVQTVISAALRGMGLGVVPAHTVARALEAGELVAITTRHRALTNRISLVRLLDRVPGRLEREFVAFVGKALARGTRA